MDSDNKYFGMSYSLGNLSGANTSQGQPGGINTFMQYNSGSIVYETQMLTTQPGQILAGSNMQINANNILNSDSKIIAGGTFNANVVTLNNQETLGSRSTQYGAESAFFRTRESCKINGVRLH